MIQGVSVGKELNGLDFLSSFGIEWEAKFPIDLESPRDDVWSAIKPSKEVGIILQQFLNGFSSDDLIDGFSKHQFNVV